MFCEETLMMKPYVVRLPYEYIKYNNFSSYTNRLRMSSAPPPPDPSPTLREKSRERDVTRSCFNAKEWQLINGLEKYNGLVGQIMATL